MRSSGVLRDWEAPWSVFPIGIAFWLDLGWRYHLVQVTLHPLRPACSWHFSASDKVSLHHHRPPPSRSLPQLPSSKRCDPDVVPLLFAFSVPGDLVHFEFSPGALAQPTQSFRQRPSPAGDGAFFLDVPGKRLRQHLIDLHYGLAWPFSITNGPPGLYGRWLQCPFLVRQESTERSTRLTAGRLVYRPHYVFSTMKQWP